MEPYQWFTDKLKVYNIVHFIQMDLLYKKKGHVLISWNPYILSILEQLLSCEISVFIVYKIQQVFSILITKHVIYACWSVT